MLQIVISCDDVQGYIAKIIFEVRQAPAYHKNMKVSGYILGEFGNLIAGEPCYRPPVQFSLLYYCKFHLCSVATQALLLYTHFKCINLSLETKAAIQAVSQL